MHDGELAARLKVTLSQQGCQGMEMNILFLQNKGVKHDFVAQILFKTNPSVVSESLETK